LARRARNTDPALVEVPVEISERRVPEERRRSPRALASHPATLRSGELLLEGELVDAGRDGVFLQTKLLVEVGERCLLALVGSGAASTPVPVRVVWLRGAANGQAPGMGLAFEVPADAAETRSAVDALLAALAG
jgi:Tfp pilus assembly protein PilZ